MDFVEEDVFKPLGMTSSTFVIGPELAPRLTVGYVNRGDGNPDPEQPAREHAGRGYKVPNGGVYSTVLDLARFMGALQGRASPAILSDESVAEMSRVHTPEDPDNGYGLGVMIRTADGGARLIGHSGSVAGYNAYMLFEPESGLGVVLLRNYNQGEASLGASGQELLVGVAGRAALRAPRVAAARPGGMPGQPSAAPLVTDGGMRPSSVRHPDRRRQPVGSGQPRASNSRIWPARSGLRKASVARSYDRRFSPSLRQLIRKRLPRCSAKGPLPRPRRPKRGS